MGCMFRAGSSGILTLLLSALCAGSAWAAAPRVVLVENAGGAPEVRQKVRASVEDALRGLGVEVVVQERINPGAGDCTAPSCLADLGRQAGASHLLEIRGSYANESYNLRLDLRDGATGRVLGSDSKECEICSAKDFYRAVQDRSAALWSRVAREQGSVSTPVPDTAGATSVSPARSGSGETAIVPPVREAHRSLWQQPLPLLGLGLILSGAVAMGFAGHYLAVDGDPDPSCPDKLSCVNKRATADLGWELLAGGGAAVLAGVAIVLWGRDAPDGPVLSLGPGRVSLSGRF